MGHLMRKLILIKRELLKYGKQIKRLANTGLNIGSKWEGSDIQFEVLKTKFKTGLGEKLPDDYVYVGRTDKSLPVRYYNAKGEIVSLKDADEKELERLKNKNRIDVRDSDFGELPF